MKNTIVLLLITLFFFSCSKEDDVVPSDSIETSQNTTAPIVQTTFIYTGIMMVNKYDSSWNAISTYPIFNINSKIVGTSPDYVLSTTFDASNLKGLTNSTIPVYIQTNSFNSFANGTGIFTTGVINGYNTRDSLSYRAFIIDDVTSNKIYLDYSGKLTSSF